HKVIEHRAWEKLKAKDTLREEKIVAFTITNAMKTKRKIGMGCKRKGKRTTKIKINGILLILTPGQSRGAIPLIPIFAALSALGSLMSGSASFNISHFRGVLSRDNLPKKPLAIECGILNLDVSSGNGSHWVALTGNTTTLSVHYFPPIDVHDDSEIALAEKITFDIGIDQIDFRTTISSNVVCNIARGSFNNHMSSHSIYEFYPCEKAIGSKLIQTPNNLIYYKLNKTNIDSITIQLVDQDHNPINNLGYKLKQNA
ncbi:Uncharacterized protein FWK35_00031721, partial [Aphis craccivora]